MRLNYVIGGDVTTLFHMDRPMYLLGYLAAQSRLYLMDKEFQIVTYTMLLSVIEFKTLVLRGELEVGRVIDVYSDRTSQLGRSIFGGKRFGFGRLESGDRSRL